MAKKWTFLRGDRNKVTECTNNDMWGCIAGDKGQVVAYVPDHGKDGPLLAAAPDLLAALEDMTQQADEDCPQESRSSHFNEALEAAQAALAKAKP